MRAAVLREVNAPLAIEEVEIAAPLAHEVRIRTTASGVCHSDLHFQDGSWPWRLPTVLGHEGAGVVTEVGSDVSAVAPGDHVVTCQSVFCGGCEWCVTGRPYLCESRSFRRGRAQPPRLSQPDGPIHQFIELSTFAEEMLVHENAVVPIPKEMPLDEASLIGCGVLTGFGAVLNTAQVTAGSRVAVIGCGGVGLAVVQAAAISGASQVVAVDVAAPKLDLARRFGASHVVDASANDAVEAVREISGGGVDFSFEVIGQKRTAEQAFEMLRKRGLATIVGMLPLGRKLEIEASDLLWEKRLQGSHVGSNRFRVDIPRIVDFCLTGRLDLGAMVSRRIALDEVNDALEGMRRGSKDVARSVICFG